MDEKYLIEESDMEKYDIGLKDLINQWKSGYQLQNIAYGVEDISTNK
jgi:hypothetical protein